MGTKPTTKTELVEYIADKERLSGLTVPALNTIWGILHRSRRSKKSPKATAANAAATTTGATSDLTRSLFVDDARQHRPARPRGHVRFDAEQ